MVDERGGPRSTADSRLPDFERFGLSRAGSAPGEGAVPIRVRGAQVGVLAISGLESGGDHDLAVEGLLAGVQA